MILEGASSIVATIIVIFIDILIDILFNIEAMFQVCP